MAEVPELPVLAVLVAALVAFVLGAVYYGVLGQATSVVPARPAAGTALVEAVRCLVLAAVVVGLGTAAGVATWAGGLLLGLALWVGFPLVLWTGALWHEREPWRTAALHGGDWLVKLLAVGALAGLLA